MSLKDTGRKILWVMFPKRSAFQTQLAQLCHCQTISVSLLCTEMFIHWSHIDITLQTFYYVTYRHISCRVSESPFVVTSLLYQCGCHNWMNLALGWVCVCVCGESF